MQFPFPQTELLLTKAIQEKQCSGLACYAQKQGVEGTFYGGASAYTNQGAIVSPIDNASIFDLASLTKILSTLNLVILAIQEERIALKQPVCSFFPGVPAAQATIENLLDHDAGLAWHLPFYEYYREQTGQLGKQKLVLDWICASSITAPVGKKTVYSDLDFLLLGFILERAYHKPLCDIFTEKLAKPLGLRASGFRRLPHTRKGKFFLDAPKARFVATETCPWRGKTLQGEVHDDNTWAMGGYAGHAGLFSTLEETTILFRHLLHRCRETDCFWPEQKPPRKFRFAKGMMFFPGLNVHDKEYFRGAIGHTGFVGTSAFYQPETTELLVLLANRVHPQREPNNWHPLRKKIHESFWQEGYSSP